jgi:hypothetical protein
MKDISKCWENFQKIILSYCLLLIEPSCFIFGLFMPPVFLLAFHAYWLPILSCPAICLPFGLCLSSYWFTTPSVFPLVFHAFCLPVGLSTPFVFLLACSRLLPSLWRVHASCLPIGFPYLLCSIVLSYLLSDFWLVPVFLLAFHAFFLPWLVHAVCLDVRLPPPPFVLALSSPSIFSF